MKRGLARLRGEKIVCDHIADYKDAEVDAQMAERGIWSEEAKPEGAHRYLKKGLTEKELFEKFKGQKVKAVVEEIHPSKTLLYFSEEGILTNLSFSEVQVVVLSEKLQSNQNVI